MDSGGSDSRRRPGLVVGLTGGIASGKTAVSRRFEALGAAVIDTDRLARAVVAPGTAGLDAIRERFGTDVIGTNGHLDRPALRQRIFADPFARRDLEAITHPRIRTAVAETLAKVREPYALIVVPLLLEAGWIELMDRVLVVDAPPDRQRERLMQRDGTDPGEADRILSSQADRQARLAIADDVITNDGESGALDGQVADLHDRYLRTATGH
ncbi:dephospho-CoA kinase [Spiribacter vilamensis]|uniref:Dephospho-CoA kinase n=1 Tax=Spiribacter vilamensis TaxID=531306 RepID=A0A4Q8CY73_9GAMM|nr:dephospho-CoA kinase [Spiribacter vilamensis]RZU97926.1 dephospho-CoA kinase [Spiribacter vilamensis]TVO61161.1 dephospho-CoA kinase [Spiribacter vilamensis]